VEYRILGPLEVVDEGRPVALGRLKERLVLAVLLLHANELVPRERLIDELWGASPPATARKAINVYVSQLRKALTRNGRDPIATADGGYRIAVEAERLDVERLRQLLVRARDRRAAGELEDAARLLRDALALWRGPTLAGLFLESHGRDEVAQLDELRLTTLMERIDCDLALGRHADVLGELHVLVGEHPLRERLRAQLMLSLYRADRQADALEAYQQARDVLVEELGIEPSPALQRLQHAILRHDPSLESPAGTAAVNGAVPVAAAAAPAPDAPAPPTRRHRRRWPLALALLLVFAACGAAAAILSAGTSNEPQIVPNSLVRLDPRSGKVVSVTRVGTDPGPIAVTPTAIWTANDGDGTISRYDLRTHGVQTRGGLSYRPGDTVDNIAADGEGSAWVTSELPWVTRFVAGSPTQPLQGWKAETIQVPGPAAGYLALGGGYLWTIPGPYTFPGQDDRVTLLDVATNRVVDSFRLRHATTALAYGDGTAWVGAFVNDAADSRHSAATTILTGPSWLYAIRAGDRPAQLFLDSHPLRKRLETGVTAGPIAIAVDRGPRAAVWVLTCGLCNEGAGHKTLLKIDPDTLDVLDKIPLDLRVDYLAVGSGAIWVAGEAADTVWQLDPNTGRILRAIPLHEKGLVTCAIAAAPTDVWVTIGWRKPHC